MKRLLLTILILLTMIPTGGLGDRCRILDAALSMLEEGNPFLTGYNETTGAGIEARFPLGCPYFWGGRDVKRILQIASPTQNSDYYRTDRVYLYGLDCVGLTRWILEEAGYAPHDAVSRLLDRSLYREAVNYKAAKTTGEARTEALDIGDLAAIRHQDGGYHCAMYIGTLWDFGYTKKTLPEALKPYLYYPLLIHCTGSSDYHERYRKELEKNGSEALPPYGGVIVTLLDAPDSAADARTPGTEEPGEPCFDLDGYHLQITDLTKEKQVRWIHPKKQIAFLLTIQEPKVFIQHIEEHIAGADGEYVIGPADRDKVKKI